MSNGQKKVVTHFKILNCYYHSSYCDLFVLLIIIFVHIRFSNFSSICVCSYLTMFQCLQAQKLDIRQ